jgi:hypothetical protein
LDYFFYPYIALTGGGDGALDSLDGSLLKNGDGALVIIPGTNLSYIYTLDEDSAAAESSPSVISPDSNAGNKRWVLVQLSTSLVPGSSATNLNFVQAGTGATTRTVQSKERDVVSVKDFGATGDGSTDDQAAIQLALDYVESIGGTLIFPYGIYRIVSGITINTGNVHLKGLSGAYIKTDFAGDIITITGAGGTKIKNITIEDLIFLANTAHTSGAVLRMISCSNVLVRSCFFGNGTTTYLQLAKIGDSTYADDCTRIHFDRCDFDSTGGDNAIELISGSIMTIDRCFFNGATAATTQAVIIQNNATRNWDGLNVSDCTCEEWPAFLNVSGEGLSNFRISGNISDRGEGYIISMVPDSTGTVKQGIISNNIFYGIASGTPGGILIEETGGGTVSDIIIDGNLIYDCDQRGIRVEACDRVVIKGNILRNCGQAGTPALTVTTSASVIVANNIIEDTGGSPLMTYGIEWGGSGTNRVKDNNVIVNYATAAEIGSA